MADSFSELSVSATGNTVYDSIVRDWSQRGRLSLDLDRTGENLRLEGTVEGSYYDSTFLPGTLALGLEYKHLRQVQVGLFRTGFWNDLRLAGGQAAVGNSWFTLTAEGGKSVEEDWQGSVPEQDISQSAASFTGEVGFKYFQAGANYLHLFSEGDKKEEGLVSYRVSAWPGTDRLQPGSSGRFSLANEAYDLTAGLWIFAVRDRLSLRPFYHRVVSPPFIPEVAELPLYRDQSLGLAVASDPLSWLRLYLSGERGGQSTIVAGTFNTTYLGLDSFYRRDANGESQGFSETLAGHIPLGRLLDLDPHFSLGYEAGEPQISLFEPGWRLSGGGRLTLSLWQRRLLLSAVTVYSNTPVFGGEFRSMLTLAAGAGAATGSRFPGRPGTYSHRDPARSAASYSTTGSVNRGLQRAKQAAPAFDHELHTDWTCGECHNPPTQAFRLSKKIAGSFTDICGNCHDDTIQKIFAFLAPEGHGATGGWDCLTCHVPPTMPTGGEAPIVKRPHPKPFERHRDFRNQTCPTCHESSTARVTDGRFAPTCKSCHDPLAPKHRVTQTAHPDWQRETHAAKARSPLLLQQNCTTCHGKPASGGFGSCRQCHRSEGVLPSSSWHRNLDKNGGWNRTSAGGEPVRHGATASETSGLLCSVCHAMKDPVAGCGRCH